MEQKPKVDSTLSKGLLILETLSEKPNGIGVSELSRQLGLTKSNTFRLLQTLTILGYVKHGSDRTYSATLKTWQVGRRTVDQLDLREICNPEMQMLSQKTGETIYLAVPQGLSVVYIDKIDSQKPIRSWNPVGGSAPIYCVGTGKAILAENYAAMRDRLHDLLDAYTDKTITDIQALDADMEITRNRGYAFDQGEFRDRILSFGAAILLPDKQPVAAMGISVPDINLPENGVEIYGALVAEAAKKVTDKLGQS